MKCLLLVAWLAVQGIPTAHAVKASDGNSYGIGYISPGLYGFFRYTESGQELLHTLRNFRVPAGDLVEGADGNFYGMTRAEILNEGHQVPSSVQRGTAFRITKGGAFKTLAVFSADLGPAGALVQAYDGNFYGVANSLDSTRKDTIFRLSPSGKVEQIADISHVLVPIPGTLLHVDLVDLVGNLIVGPKGHLFGVSRFVDDESLASVFKVSLQGEVTILKRFKQGTTRGSSKLEIGDNGNLYLPLTTSSPYEIVTSNLPPVANNDSFELPVIHARVVANDTDPNKDPVRIVSVTDGSHGTVTFTPEGRVTYSPGPEFGSAEVQSDTFTYTIRDPLGGTSTATVTVNAPQDILRAGAGSYNGLITSGVSTKGTLNLTLTKRGTFTGAVFFDGIKTPLSGSFEADGTCSVTINRKAPLAALTLTLKLDVSSNEVTGTVSDGTGFYPTNTSRNLSLFSQGRQTPLRGAYTVLIPNNETGAGIPAGTGFARMLVTAAGAVQITGKLGDGTPFSAGSTLHSDDTMPLYVKAYLRKEGYLAGLVTFQLSDTGDASGLLTWHKPVNSKDAIYPEGFTAAPAFMASRYTKLPWYLLVDEDFTLIVGDKPAKQLEHREPLTLRVWPPQGDQTKVKLDSLTGFFKGAYFDGGVRYALEGALYQNDEPARIEGLSFDQNKTIKVSVTDPIAP